MFPLHTSYRFLSLFSSALSVPVALFLQAPLLLFTLACMVTLILTAPILFAYLPPVPSRLPSHAQWRKHWKRTFGEVDLSRLGRAMEIAARVCLFLVITCLLLLSVFAEVEWFFAVVAAEYVDPSARLHS